MAFDTVSRPAAFSSGGDLHVIDHLLARGEIVAAQLPSPSHWTPEKKLAAAVLTSALLSIRDNSHSPVRRRRREAREDLEWIESDEGEGIFSFTRLCELFGLEPEWAREKARLWATVPGRREGVRFSTHRHAA